MQLQANTIKVDYDYKHVPTIKKFTLANNRVRGIMGPFGSGKSTGCLMEIIRRAHLQVPGSDGIRRIRVAVVRNSYPQLKDTTIRTVMDWLPPRYFGNYKIADHEYIINGFPGVQIEMLFRALDKPEHVSNLLSMELTMAWLNEAREIPFAIFSAIDGRINRYPSIREGGCTWSGIILDTNPPDEDSWWYKYFEEHADPSGSPFEHPPDAAIFKQPSGLAQSAENRKNLGETYYEELAKGKSKDFVQVYIHGKYGYVKDGKPVYTNWNETLHTATHSLRPIPGVPLIVAIDFGLTPSAVICQSTPKGYFHVLDELVSEGMGIRNFIYNILKPHLATKYRGFQIIGSADPAGVQKSQADEKTCFDELREAGFRIIPARTNALAARLGAVEALLDRLIDGKPRFQMDPTCKVLKKGFNGAYKYQRMRTNYEKYSPEPMKNEVSHIQDALQYAAMYVDERIRTVNRSNLVRMVPKYKPVSNRAGY